MKRKTAPTAIFAIAMTLSCPIAWAQTYTYDFDGVADSDPQPDDPTDWMTSENWSDGGFDPHPSFGPQVPDLDTRVEIQTSTYGVDAPEIGPGDEAQAYGVRIGRFGGPGLLTMSGGTLEVSTAGCPGPCDRRLRVGNADVIEPESRHPGTFNISGGVVTTDTLWIGSGSHGEMNMSGGEVNTRGSFYFDWTSDLTYDTNSVLNMSGGTINVGTFLRMYRLSSLNLSGGEILVTGPAELGTETGLNPSYPQTPNVTVNITDGLLATNHLLKIGGSVVLDGGVLRAASFNESASAGTIEVNEGGILQFNNSQESIASVQSLITAGFITTSSPQGTAGFAIDIVDVDGTDFTQVSFATGLIGDYNQDGFVNAADYVMWRRDPDSFGGGQGYLDWVTHFGPASGSGSGNESHWGPVPEPISLYTVWFGWTIVILLRHRTDTSKI